MLARVDGFEELTSAAKEAAAAPDFHAIALT
jgi:hypothetical protein